MRKILFLTLSLCCLGSTYSQAQQQIQLKDFQLLSSSQVKEDGKALSQSTYSSDNKWYKASVPTTVLNALVHNGVYPSPYQGMNNMLIPDASDEFNASYDLAKYSYLPNKENPWKKPYWFRTTFEVAAAHKGKNFQLIFKAINYRAEVWLNGTLIADSSKIVGMFSEWNLAVSKAIKVGQKNVLAVKIYPLDYPGTPDKEQLKALESFYLNGGPSGDIGKNVTQACSVGWDWIPPVRDRNMGIWQPVYLRISGESTIGKVKLVTDLPNLPDTSLAKISLNLSVNNHSGKAQKGTLMVQIKPLNFTGKEQIQFQKMVDIAADGQINIDLDAANTAALALKNPKLWWPNGYGKPNLYQINLKLMVNRAISDDTTFNFGVRTVSSKAVLVDSFARRDFYVNGKRVHLNGGAWVPDMLLDRDAARYDYEMHLCRSSNINLVRIWGGGVTPGDDFWDAADRYGMMVWSDFWITGDTQGEFKGSPDWPLDGNAFIQNVRNTILRIRNHASLLVWTGGNEGHARKELYDAMRKSVIELDGTRTFIPSSSGFAKLPAGWDASYPDGQSAGVYSGGPYAWQTPKHYYELANGKKDWVFKDETGVPSQPPYSTLRKIIPDTTWDKSLPYPMNHSWGYHDACTSPVFFNKYEETMENYYGKPSTLQDFSTKMQLMNAMSYRSIFESVGNKINETGGVMLWKLNAAFPSVVWQIYDWYLMQNAGYYFMKNALEPIHLQYNYDNQDVSLVNRSYVKSGDLTAQITLMDIQSKVTYQKTVQKLKLNTVDVLKVADMASEIAKISGPQFLFLTLKNAKGAIVSKNVYWFAANDDFTAFNTMAKAKVQSQIISVSANGTQSKTWKIKLSNTGKQIAFFLNPKMMLHGEEILPSFWDDNYLSLAPGQSSTLSVEIPNQILKGKTPQLVVDGLNVNP